MSFIERYHRYLGKHTPKTSDSDGGDTESLGLGKRSNPDEHNEEDWTGTNTPEQTKQDSEELQKRHIEDLDRDRVTRHTQGTQQVEQIITRTKTASKNFLMLSVTGAIIIFVVGFFSLPQTREILNLIPCINLDTDIAASGNWVIYLLLFLPTTLMAVLGITLWITGLKFSAQIYGGIQGAEEKGSNEAVSECLKTVQELLKQSSGSP
ncbi:hypothetical protein [Vreelandella lionensis]|uniref:hypothetical protein n=1 Tax=Vreelandella lionensis TaxID=1144478 RepID=UPI0009F16BF7|nr:hypothetical protein [Halomonas lionensis]